MLFDSYHVTFVHLRTHGQLDDEPRGVPQDEGGDEVPVDDVPQAADAPVRRAEENKPREKGYDFTLRGKMRREEEVERKSKHVTRLVGNT